MSRHRVRSPRAHGGKRGWTGDHKPVGWVKAGKVSEAPEPPVSGMWRYRQRHVANALETRTLISGLKSKLVRHLFVYCPLG